VSSRLRRTGALDPEEARGLAVQAAGALGAVHAVGIVHRDLKPDNLFLCPDYQTRGALLLKVLDFGIAKLGAASNQLGSVKTRTGSVMGTPAYMSPEQCLGTREVDHRADIYALGVILYELVCGRTPFESEGFGEMVHMQISALPTPPRVHNPAVPEDLQAVILRALEKNPADRFQSMDEMQTALTSRAFRAAAETQPAFLGPGHTLRLDQPARPTGRTTDRSTDRSTDRASDRTTDRVRDRATGRTKDRLGTPTTFSGAAREVPASLRPRVWPGRVAGIGLVVAVGVGGFVLWRQQAAPSNGEASGRATPAPDSTGPAAPAPSSASQPTEVAPTITARIGSQPAGARVVRQRDGAVMGVTPFQETWPKQDGTEDLRLQLPGYEPEAIAVPLDRDVHLSLTLRKIEAAAAPAPPRAPAPSARHRTGGHGHQVSPRQKPTEPEPEPI